MAPNRFGFFCPFGILAISCAFIPDNSAPGFFLTGDEITRSMVGTNRSSTGITDYSHGNDIRPLIDGEEAMAAILHDILRAGSGDYIHLMAWDLNLDMLLNPRHPKPKETRLGTVLSTALVRGVDVRVLYTEHSIVGVPIPGPILSCQELNKQCRLTTQTCCAPDSRNVAASHHAKAWAMAIGDQQIAYVGGMDMTSGRWDNSSHDPHDATRQTEPLFPFNFPWHDELFRVAGPAANDIERTFWQRWHDPQIPFTGYNLQPYAYAVRGHAAGDLSIQVLRTIGCRSAQGGYYQNFAPRGEYSNSAAFYKAVDKARDYIYIDDQFVHFAEALDAVAARLPHLRFGVILATDDNSLAVSSAFVQYKHALQHFQALALRKLRESPHREKVHLFTLRTKDHSSPIYVHSKTVIIDDEYVFMGSCGMEMNSFTSNFEINLGIQGPSLNPTGPSSFAGKLRRRIWGEFLQLDHDDARLLNPATAISEFERQASMAEGSLVQRYWPTNYTDWYDQYMWSNWETDGRCRQQALIV